MINNGGGGGHRSHRRDLLISGLRVTLHRNWCYPSLSPISTLLTLIRPYKPPVAIVPGTQHQHSPVAGRESEVQPPMLNVTLVQVVQPSVAKTRPDPGQPWPLQSPVIIVPDAGERRCLARGLGLHSNHTQHLISTHPQTLLSLWLHTVALIIGTGKEEECSGKNLLSSANVICMLLTCSMLAQCQEARI